MDSCLSCAADLEHDGYIRICSVCKKDCCIFCTINDDGERICQKCRITAVKVEQLRQFGECGLCEKSYPPLMFYNCTVCGEQRCFNCIRRFTNEAEGFCKLCSNDCVMPDCNELAIQDNNVCGICSQSCSMCPVHAQKREYCREYCGKKFCIDCVERITREPPAIKKRQKLFCSEHKGKCNRCATFINSLHWRICEVCSVIGCRNCKDLFPIAGRDVCRIHTVECIVCSECEAAPGYSINGYDGATCWDCFNTIQKQLKELCLVWRRYQPSVCPVIEEIGVLLLKEACRAKT